MVTEASRVTMVTLTVSVVCGTTNIFGDVWASHSGVVNQKLVPDVSGTDLCTGI